MPNISETPGHNFTVPAAPDRSPRDSAIARLKDFTYGLDEGIRPADEEIKDFIRIFDSTELLGPLLRGLSDEKKEDVLRAAARYHVASFGRGRDFLAKCNPLHLVDYDSATLFGALPAELRAAMLADAYIGDRGQIVVPFPDIGLCIPLGRSSLGTGEGALTTHEIQKLLTDPGERFHCRLELFSGKLMQFDAQTPDTETCHVWSDLIDRCIDGKPIAEFSEEKAVLEALASTLKELTDRVDARGGDEEFPMVRLLTHCAEAYFLAGDLGACGAALFKLTASYMDKLEYGADVGVASLGASAATLAASVLARNALQRWEDGRFAEAVVSYGMAMSAYAQEGVFRGIHSVPPAPISEAVDETVPLPTLVEHISRTEFEAAWADRRAKTEEMRSQVEDARTRAIMKRLGQLRVQPSGPRPSN
ncbi:hypothetical protein [Pandoraea commovens]|uniref:Uncharacterized protein n=1 Tax=Pandoraea commovens TaxID=2508289 RepID=A0ABY5QIR4_9BURK|nr:hypothetical protein [Pandoraea commovens]UVA80253.1 hypothetical protein NTU39_04300 [Pandoraea commovens]